MHGLGAIDGNKVIDWGRVSLEYARYRPGPPDSFYSRLAENGIGLRGQRILDLGTGTGVLARRFAKQGCQVTGLDIAENQVRMAQELANLDGVKVEFLVSDANQIALADHDFDAITANQCWLYFDKPKAISEVKRLLRRNGLFSTSHLCWLPHEDDIAGQTEELILKHNPDWSAAGFDGKIPTMPQWAQGHFKLRNLVVYDEPIRFTRESWKGRMRACRGVGVVMSPEELQVFEADLDQLLAKIAGNEFEILHRIDAHIFELA
ncbi:MAG: class I SAM-dependent methyltransferase [Bdellovibrionales bacterium]|nr:class I SAM-dependent methyltransferase [Bdellovibrionales bacterium]